MTTFLFIWMMQNGVLQKPVVKTFYTLEACNAAARKAENAHLLFEGIMSTTQIRAYCSPKKLGVDQ